MKCITKEDLGDLIPGEIDIALAKEKGLASDSGLDDTYFELYSIYYNYLEKYLSKLINFDTYINYLEERNPNFKEVPEEEMDIYQYLSNTKYFYIRNTLYVEKLSKEDISYLLNNPNEYNDQVKELIKRTFREVITTSLIETPTANIFYGPLSPTYEGLNDDLVIGLRFAEEDSDLYETEDLWFDDYGKRRAIIKEMKEKMPVVINGTDIKYIEYFEESVKKKESENYVK